MKVTRTISFFFGFFVARNENLNVLSLLVRKTRTDWLVNVLEILEMRRMSSNFFFVVGGSTVEINTNQKNKMVVVVVVVVPVVVLCA